MHEHARRRLRVLRFILWPLGLLAGALIIAGGGLAFWLRHAARGALPQLDGELRLSGLSGPVTVSRDASGTPHIRAENLEDLVFAQGFVTAQDRLFQMDLSRRNAAGALSEVLGPPLVSGGAAAQVLELDRTQRYLQLGRAAANGLEHAEAPARRYLEAYARGVNACIDAPGRPLPLEFRILGYKPKPWQPLDSILVGLNISQQMNSQFWAEWRRERISRRLPPNMLLELYPNGSWRDRAPGEPSPAKPETAVLPAGLIGGRLPPGPPAPAPATGDEFAFAAMSNNWVVSGAHTSSGKPLLANDMHLIHTMPGVWYQAHLAAGDLDVIGYTLPGIPFVIGGHNRRIAWGFTNLGPDVTDLYVEHFNERGEYETPTGWKKPEVRRETVRVKGRPDVLLDVEVTRHGPIITPILGGETRKISLKWIIHENAPQELPFLKLNLARNWDEFRAAFEEYTAPAMNLVYADTEGNIGYQATGLIPIRASGDGLTPADGRSNGQEWTGYIPRQEMPSVLNPPSGILATANSRIAPAGYKHMMANQWVPAHRTQRIYEVLESWIASGKRLAPADMLALQTDVYSDFDRMAARELALAVRRSPGAGGRALEVAAIWESWDGRVTPDSAAAAFVTLARRNLSRLVLEPRLGDDWREYRWFGSTIFWERLLKEKPAHWLPPGTPSFDALLTAAVEQTVSDPSLNGATRRTTYGDVSRLNLNHPIFGSVPILRRYSGPGIIRQPGNGMTVWQAISSFGPSQRLTVDLGDFDQSTSNVVTGQSGQIASPHYLDHFPHWLAGTTLPLPFGRDAVRAAEKHRLLLLPLAAGGRIP